MTNVIVARQRTIAVSTNATSGIINTTVPVTLKNNPVLSSGGSATSITALNDVNVVNAANGATLVYDPTTNTFLVEPLNFVDIVGVLDSGTF